MQEFCRTLALLSRGSLTQKLDWIFSLYDVNRDGAVCLADLEEITASVTVITLTIKKISDVVFLFSCRCSSLTGTATAARCGPRCGAGLRRWG